LGCNFSDPFAHRWGWVKKMLISLAIRSSDPPTQAIELASDRGQRIEALVREHFSFVWRVARRLGLATADAEDTTQRVLITATKRLDDLVPGKERAFLFRVVTYEVARANRMRRRRREQLESDLDADQASDDDPETLLDQRQAREQLDAILAAMSKDLREAFVLFEIEGFGQREIAAALAIAEGTVASRLRRAREQFARVAVRYGVLVSKNGGW
jgi:RNA polymerase sigma-70 factor, ECF subfamily